MHKLSYGRVKSNRRATFFTCALIGFILAFTTLLAIIHEYGHVLGAGPTIQVHIKDWQTVTYRGEPTLGFLLAGWAFQWWVWFCVWMLCQYLGSNYPNFLFDIGAGFSWGYVHGTTIQALRSQDFADIERLLGMPLPEIQVAWLACTIPILIVGWLVLINVLKKMY